MDVNDYQRQVVAVIEQYGRPATLGGHLEKLGEEVGELAHAVYAYGVFSSYPQIEPQLQELRNHIAEECCDVINVCTSLLDTLGEKLEPCLQHKIKMLEQRVANGRRDKRCGGT